MLKRPVCLRLLILLMLVSHTFRAFSQQPRILDSTFFNNKRDFIDLMISLNIQDSNGSALTRSKRMGNNVRISVMPSVGGVPHSSGLAFVTAIGATFFLGSPQTTNLSNIYFTPYTNFKGKYVIPFRSYIWTKDNKWNLVGDYRYLIFPDYNYGLGSQTKQADQQPLDYNHFRFHQNILHKVISYWVMGGGVHFDTYGAIDETQADSNKRYMENYQGEVLTRTRSNGLAFTTAFDSRLNSLNAQKGVYAGLTYWYTPTWMKSTSSWHSIFAEFKTYHSFNPKKQNLLAFWTYYWDVFAGKAPYLDLPSTFADPTYRSGRGYYPNRFRGTAMWYGEVEYRFDITKDGLWGGTAFANVQTLRAYSKFGRLAPAAGLGLRLKFNKYNNTNLTFDVGVGSESWNYFFSIGEFF